MLSELVLYGSNQNTMVDNCRVYLQKNGCPDARRKYQSAKRSKEYGERQRSARSAQGLPPPQQLQQGGKIITFVPIEDEQPETTAPELGLRVQGLLLAGDSNDAQLQQTALRINDYQPLQDEDEVDLSTFETYQVDLANDLLDTKVPLEPSSEAAAGAVDSNG